MPNTRRGSLRTRSFQPRNSADTAIVAGYVLLLTAAVAAALSGGGVLHWALIALVTTLAVAVVTRTGPQRAGLVLAMIAAFAAPWNAVGFGVLRPGDLALVAGIALLVFSRHSWATLGGLVLPWWLLGLTAVVVVLTLGHELIPVDPAYLASRQVLDAGGVSRANPFTNIGIGTRWLVSLIGVPLLAVLVRAHGHRWLARFAVAFVAGAAVSGVVAFTDSVGVTAISATFIVPDIGGRQAGLTVHPNHLAATACLAFPFAMWLFARRARGAKPAAVVLGAALLLAVYESGSRGGAVCLLLAAALSLVLIRKLRSGLPFVVAGLFAVTFLVFGLVPGVLDHLLSSVRLQGGVGVEASDQVRAAVGAQGTLDFRHSPFFGIGMQSALDAHNIYRQTLAAGGVLLFGAFVAFGAGAVRAALRLAARVPLAAACAASLAAWLLFGVVENLLCDRFLYVPVGIVVALLQHRVDDDAAADDARLAAADAPLPTVGAVAAPAPAGSVAAASGPVATP